MASSTDFYFKYFSWANLLLIKKLRFIILLLWFGTSILGMLYGFKFFDETTTTFTAPPGSDAEIATNTMNEVLINWSLIFLFIVFSSTEWYRVCKYLY